MKLTHLVIAIGALSAGTANATIERLSGATASTVNAVKALRNLCLANSGTTFAVYKTSSAANALGNIFTATCTGGAFTGAVDQVRFNVAGGSLSAVNNRNGNTGATSVPMINPGNATCANIAAGSGSLGFMGANELKNCGATGQSNELADGGFMDVEGPIFRANSLAIPPEVNDSTDFVPSSFVQSFGVGVSARLYAAMQEYQTAKGLLQAKCATFASGVYTATNDTTPDCQPSMPRATMAAFMATGNNLVKKAGANVLIGGTATTANDLPSGVSIATAMPLKSNFRYCRRPATSGTQAAAQLYFLNSPTGSGSVGGQLGVVGSATAPATVSLGATFTATTNSGTGDVRDCLDGIVRNSAGDITSTTPGFYAGIVSMENNPIGGNTYRFTKLNNQSGTEGVAGASQTSEAIAGRYDFVFQTYKYCPGGTCASILDAIDGALPAGASTPGLFLSSESIYVRGIQGNVSTRPVTAKP